MTLKERLKSAEKQEENIKYIVETLKSSDKARLRELKDTKDLLQFSQDKIQHLENVTVQQINKVQTSERKMTKLKLKLHAKNAVIKDLQDRLKRVQTLNEYIICMKKLSYKNCPMTQLLDLIKK